MKDCISLGGFILTILAIGIFCLYTTFNDHYSWASLPESNQPSNRTAMNENSSDVEPLISDTLQGAIVGGILGFASSIGVDYLKNWLNRPRISIDKKIYLAEFEDPNLARALNESTDFTGIRIKIKNDGKKAAEECKATLVKDNAEFRVGWLIPREDLTVTLNAHDTEYLDLCAFGNVKKDSWRRIFTTERGYGKDQSDGRDLDEWSKNESIQAKLKISSKNARACNENISILDKPDSKGNVVYFRNGDKT
jgi:hypothetical protein